MSMWKKNLNPLKQSVWPKKTTENVLKKTWKVEKKGVLIWYRCATKVKQVWNILAGKVTLQVIIVQSQYVKVSFN